MRDRQQRGPVTADAAPTVTVILVRRFQCLRCDAIMTVVPREVAPRRHYSRSAIALALARLGLLGERAATVRRAVCAWPIATTPGWPALRRWVAAARRGTLFASLAAIGGSAVAIAARVAQAAMGHAPPSVRGAGALALVFAGAVVMV